MDGGGGKSWEFKENGTLVLFPNFKRNSIKLQERNYLDRDPIQSLLLRGLIAGGNDW